jgi:serine/threonine protein phosphatase PrpC
VIRFRCLPQGGRQFSAMWIAVGAKATGSSHLSTNLPCQDEFGYQPIGNGVVAIAVADGAGSARLSQLGASLAVERSLQALMSDAEKISSKGQVEWTAAIHSSFAAARTALFEYAAEHNENVSEFATTLQVALISQNAVVHGRVGDGAAVARIDDQLVAVSPAPSNAFVNETTFLTRPEEPHPETAFLEGNIAEFAVFTDGLQPLAIRLSDWHPHLPFFEPLFSFVRRSVGETRHEQLVSFLNSAPVDKRTDDDRALVVCVLEDPGVN